MLEFDSPYAYIESATSLKEKITKICAIQDALFDAALKAATGENILEYNLDDGQAKVRAIYRTSGAIMQSYHELESLKQMCMNKLNGRIFIFKDGLSNNGRC